jgi:hypothetical protein
LKQGEKISNLENALPNLIHLPLTICKRSLNGLTKEFAKTKHVVQAWSKMLNKKETFHAYLVSSFIGSNSKQPLHLHYANKFNCALLYLLWFVLASITKKGEIERELGLHLVPK